jgi:hypothetical protein
MERVRFTHTIYAKLEKYCVSTQSCFRRLVVLQIGHVSTTPRPGLPCLRNILGAENVETLHKWPIRGQRMNVAGFENEIAGLPFERRNIRRSGAATYIDVVAHLRHQQEDGQAQMCNKSKQRYRDERTARAATVC